MVARTDDGATCVRHCLRAMELTIPMCDHVFDTTTRYDADEKELTFLLVCPECRTERVVERLAYEPRPKLSHRPSALR